MKKELSFEWRIMLAFLGVAAISLTGLFSPNAFALTNPTAGSMAYDVYNIAVNQILQGPIGFVGGVAMVVIGAATFPKSWPLGAATAISGGAMLKAPAIVGSMGLII